jgi:hypothetical protein
VEKSLSGGVYAAENSGACIAAQNAVLKDHSRAYLPPLL